MKVQGAPITNIDQSSVLFENLMSEVDEFEANYDVLNRMGKYIAFVKLPNGKSAFVGLTAPVYSPESFNELLLEMQNEATRVAENNVNKDGTVNVTDIVFGTEIVLGNVDWLNQENLQNLHF